MTSRSLASSIASLAQLGRISGSEDSEAKLVGWLLGKAFRLLRGAGIGLASRFRV